MIKCHKPFLRPSVRFRAARRWIPDKFLAVDAAVADVVTVVVV